MRFNGWHRLGFGCSTRGRNRANCRDKTSNIDSANIVKLTCRAIAALPGSGSIREQFQSMKNALDSYATSKDERLNLSYRLKS